MGNEQQTEIDLIDLLIKFYKFVIKKKWLLLTSFIIGSTIGVIIIKLNPYKHKNYYKKNYILFSPAEIPKEIIADLIKGLEENIPASHNDGDLTHLSELLNLSTDFAKNLKEITIIDNTTTIKENGEVKFSIEVFDKDKMDSIANSIIYYINANPFVKSRYEIFINKNKETLSLINKKIHELDSSFAIKNGRQISNTSITINEETAELSYVTLFEKKQKAEEILKLFQNNNLAYIEINSPTHIVKRSSMIIPTIIGYGFIGIFIGIFIGAISKIRNHFKTDRP